MPNFVCDRAFDNAMEYVAFAVAELIVFPVELTSGLGREPVMGTEMPLAFPWIVRAVVCGVPGADWTLV